MKVAVILTLFLLAIGVQAADWRDGGYPDTIMIGQLPYTCNTDNAVYLLSGNLNSNDGGIRISGRYNIELNGQGDTIRFDVDGSGGAIGLEIANNAHHIIVRNLTITQATNAGSYGSPCGDNATGIRLEQCEYVYMKDCNAHVGGHSSMCVDGSMGYKQAIEVHGGNYTSFVRSFDSRHSADATAFKLSEPKPNPDTTFHFYVHEIRIDSTCHTGLLVGGVAWVDSNYVRIDTYNQKPNTSWANAHAIADAGRAWAGSHFNYNTVRTGANHYGGRGMYFNFAAGSEQYPVEMAYNDIRVTQGYTTEADAARGLRVRWGCFYLRVHHNYIQVSCDDDPSTDHIGSSAHGIWFGAIGEEGSQLGAHNWFYNNEIHANYYGSPNNAPGQATCFIADQIRDPNQPLGNDNRSFDNHFISNLRCMQIGADGHQGNEWVSVGDIFEWVDPQYTCTWGFSGAVGVGAGGVQCLNNQLIDPIFVNTTSAAVTNRSGGGSKSIYVNRSVQISVVGTQNNEPIPGATIRIWDRFGNTGNNATAIATIPTNGRGIAIDTLPYAYHRWDGYTETADSTYNDYVIRVEAFGLSAQQTVTLGDIASNRSGGMVIALELDTLGQEVINNAASAPTANNPLSGATVASITPQLVVNNGVDPDGDNLTYDFELYNESGQTLLQSQSGISETPAVTSWTVPQQLAPGTVYRWRARCSDGLEYSPWMNTIPFTTPSTEDNTAPDPPAMHAPEQGSITNQIQPTLSVINGSDVDHDALTYFFELYDAAGATLLASAGPLNEGPYYTDWTVSEALTDGATYTWRARCYDDMAFSDWTEPWAFTIDQSVVMTLPTASSPVDGAAVVGEPIVLIVNNSDHSSGLDVAYDFFVYADASLTNLIDEILDVPEESGKTLATCSFSPNHNQQYWWQTSASDGSFTTDRTQPTSFTFYSFGSSETTIPEPTSPPNGASIDGNRPLLVTVNILEPGDHDYYFEIASDANFVDLVDVSYPVDQDPDGTTSWRSDEILDGGEDYYWHVRADNYAFSQTYTFQVEPEVIAYPNPVRFSNSDITFQLPNEPADLLIQTVSGETVLLQKGISGLWQWDGRNSSGNPVASGTYLWYVTPTGQKGKIVVKP